MKKKAASILAFVSQTLMKILDGGAMKHTRSFNEMQDRARAIRRRYAGLEHARHGRSWNTTEIALGFVGDVGDLAKLIQASEGIRSIEGHEARLEHELADCLWSVMTLADQLDVDLERAFMATMDELDARLNDSTDASN